MNTIQIISYLLRLLVALPIAAAAITATAQSTFAEKCTPKMSGLEQRLYQKSSEGPDALRHFIFIRRGIYQLDMAQVQDWAMSVEATRSVCMKTADVTAPTATTIASAR
jgi:hypothetical protein